jgi:hypothetical protein
VVKANDIGIFSTNERATDIDSVLSQSKIIVRKDPDACFDEILSRNFPHIYFEGKKIFNEVTVSKTIFTLIERRADIYPS